MRCKKCGNSVDCWGKNMLNKSLRVKPMWKKAVGDKKRRKSLGERCGKRLLEKRCEKIIIEEKMQEK
jgi:hypothetical protein